LYDGLEALHQSHHLEMYSDSSNLTLAVSPCVQEAAVGSVIRSMVCMNHWTPALLRRGDTGVVVKVDRCHNGGTTLINFGHVEGWLGPEDYCDTRTMEATVDPRKAD